ncbi:carbonic anhydrase/acetyltransferase-like protein (isoleucine patch superfamily) [Herbihabitans rhizosphaerae]|uniref:Carbonic anhydrase/acetyltransferase-like protein (Isoleucine patch superfamily) n=1 Tax=Herbihabitans rhizosphaerae TaxID=1872711 RepID=A0A4Q7KNE7_9PSEU|nr:gamma carbonic anhydrase family protein [Herbihabitans rhizosphaerae]RZS37490.1 carbonic anhydrase/acetyltransferase-like protein (isoleucine patch superfamily) [Herbihabitans rhizosphaerae]
MPLFSFEGVSPQVHPEAWIAPTATIVGNVIVEARASVWYGAVVRGDFTSVIIREGANVQDNSVIHVAVNGVEIGRGATIGHGCVVHDCTIGEEALIGNSATVLDGAKIGARAMVAAGALVTPGMEIPPETIAMGSPAKRQVPLDGQARMWVEGNPLAYQELARRHAAGVQPLEG